MKRREKRVCLDFRCCTDWPTDRAFRPSVHPIRHAGGVGKEREGITTTFSSVKKEGREKYGQKIHA